MSLHAHKQATTPPRSHDMDKVSEGGWSAYPANSQMTRGKCNDADSDRCDDYRSELPGPVSIQTCRKMARATRKVLEGDFNEDKEVNECIDDDATFGLTGDDVTY